MRDPWETLKSVMLSWHEGKLMIEHAVSISHDTLHLIVGMLVWLAAAVLSRRPLRSWVPWNWTFVLIFWNELVDLYAEQWPGIDRGIQYGEGVKDLVLTMLIPTILLLTVRLRPELFGGAPARARSRRAR